MLLEDDDDSVSPDRYLEERICIYVYGLTTVEDFINLKNFYTSWENKSEMVILTPDPYSEWFDNLFNVKTACGVILNQTKSGDLTGDFWNGGSLFFINLLLMVNYMVTYYRFSDLKETLMERSTQTWTPTTYYDMCSTLCVRQKRLLIAILGRERYETTKLTWITYGLLHHEHFFSILRACFARNIEEFMNVIMPPMDIRIEKLLVKCFDDVEAECNMKSKLSAHLTLQEAPPASTMVGCLNDYYSDLLFLSHTVESMEHRNMGFLESMKSSSPLKTIHNMSPYQLNANMGTITPIDTVAAAAKGVTSVAECAAMLTLPQEKLLAFVCEKAVNQLKVAPTHETITKLKSFSLSVEIFSYMTATRFELGFVPSNVVLNAFPTNDAVYLVDLLIFFLIVFRTSLVRFQFVKNKIDLTLKVKRWLLDFWCNHSSSMHLFNYGFALMNSLNYSAWKTIHVPYDCILVCSYLQNLQYINFYCEAAKINVFDAVGNSLMYGLKHYTHLCNPNTVECEIDWHAFCSNDIMLGSLENVPNIVLSSTQSWHKVLVAHTYLKTACKYGLQDMTTKKWNMLNEILVTSYSVCSELFQTYLHQACPNICFKMFKHHFMETVKLLPRGEYKNKLKLFYKYYFIFYNNVQSQ